MCLFLIHQGIGVHLWYDTYYVTVRETECDIIPNPSLPLFILEGCNS